MTSAIHEQLVNKIAEIEVNHRPFVSGPVAIDILGFDKIFPGNCLPGGCLIELLPLSEGAGAWTIAILLARQACGGRKVLVVADEAKKLFPPAVARLGIDLRRTLVLQSSRREKVLAGIVQSLRCPAVGSVIGCFERLTAIESRSLQLAAETGGGIGFLLRPAQALATPSFALARLVVKPIGSPGSRQKIEIEVARIHGCKTGPGVLFEVDHETGDVHLPSKVAPAAAVARRA